MHQTKSSGAMTRARARLSRAARMARSPEAAAPDSGKGRRRQQRCRRWNDEISVSGYGDGVGGMLFWISLFEVRQSSLTTVGQPWGTDPSGSTSARHSYRLLRGARVQAHHLMRVTAAA
jgi:hypothetical protein